MKFVTSFFKIDIEWIWYRWCEMLKILYAEWIESVTTMIFEIPWIFVAWLILYLIANNLASMLVTFTTWYIVLTTGLLRIWICMIEVAMSFLILVRCGSHWDRSLQNGLRDERTCGTTLASAYMLCHLSATWLQLQMNERKSEWKWVLIGVSPLNTRDRVQWEFIFVDYQTSKLQCNY